MQICQLGLNTADMPGALQLYSALGFGNAGSQCLWGDTVKVQGLSEQDRAIVWWMVGPQSFFQLEFFQHTSPPQRPLRPDWSPGDLGWVRYGFVVADLPSVVAAVEALGIAMLGAVQGEAGSQRVAFRDPYVGIVVELLERGAAPAWAHAAEPALVYAASSVSDLDGARAYYRDTLGSGAEIRPLEDLHDPAHEALWGLAGREREGFVVRYGEIAVEVVRYARPGCPRPIDYRTSDQGMTNVAFGSRSKPEIEAVFARLAAAGITPPFKIEAPDICGGYIVDAEREVELVAVPASFDPFVGFEAKAPFLSKI